MTCACGATFERPRIRCAECSRVKRAAESAERSRRVRAERSGLAPSLTCPECSVVFVRGKHNQRFCSDECRYRAKSGSTRRVSTCAQCGVVFADRHGAPSRYCSRECVVEARRRDNPDRVVGASCPVSYRTCYCGKVFVVFPVNRRTCGRAACRLAYGRAQGRAIAAAKYVPRVRSKVCPTCDAPFATAGHSNQRIYCSEPCYRRSPSARDQKHEDNARRRARNVGAFVAKVSRRAIFERDGWRCQLCRKALKRDAVAPHPLSPSLDHIIPLAAGGTHEPRNVQAAHFSCNTRRGTGGTVQLRWVA